MLLKADGSRTLIVRPTSIRIVAWACITLFLFCGVMSWRADAGWVTFLFFGFVLLGAYLLTAGSVEMDARHVTYRTPIGAYRIRWDEVSRIETDAQGGNIVFWGEGKRLNAVGPGYWSGEDKLEMLVFLSRQVEKYGIEVVETQKAMFRLTKNTKVGR
jgi:hypothetical protein